jgi:hypothetical protein
MCNVKTMKFDSSSPGAQPQRAGPQLNAVSIAPLKLVTASV